MSGSYRILLILAFVFIVSGFNCNPSTYTTIPSTPQPELATVVVDVNAAIVEPFTGFGVQWDPYSYPPSTADWQMTLDRLDYMRPSLFRVMSMATDYCLGFDQNGAPIYVWNQGDTVIQQHLWQTFRILDYAQAHNIDVILGEWAWPSDLATPNASPIAGPDDPRWARIVADYVTYLTNTKHYTIIKYYNFMNEPNGDWMWPSGQQPSFSRWSTGIRNLRAEFDSRNLNAIAIIGPDNAWSWEWLDQAEVLGFLYQCG